MKEILFLAYHFPPAQNGAVARFFSFYNHLPKFGYKPIIITVDNFGKLENEKDIYRFPSLVTIMEHPLYKRYYFKHLKKLYFDRFDPTFDFRWRFEIKKHIKEILSEHSIPAVFSSFPRAESLFTGLYISKKFDLPLISEFRDGYAFESIITNPSFTTKNYLKYFEKKIVSKSELVLTVTDKLTEYFNDKFKTGKVHTVFNGYEQSDFDELDKIEFKPDKNKIKIVNFGSIDVSGKRDVSFLYNAIQKLKKSGVITKYNFELSLIGRYTDKEIGFINDLSLDDIIKIYPSMPKLDGFKLIKGNYNYLLLYGLPGITHNIPSKTFEYIKLGKPILGICKGNESAEIIKSTGTGEVCGFNVDDIASLFEKALKSEIYFQPNQQEIEKYNRINQVEKLAKILDSYNF